MSQLCVEQVEGYVYRLRCVPHAVDDDGETVIVPLLTRQFRTRDGQCVLPIRITVSNAPCIIQFAVLKVPFHHSGARGPRTGSKPSRVGCRKTTRFHKYLSVMAVPRADGAGHDFTMTLRFQAASITFAEFAEAIFTFREVIDRWARRRYGSAGETPEWPKDGSADGQ